MLYAALLAVLLGACGKPAADAQSGKASVTEREADDADASAEELSVPSDFYLLLRINAKKEFVRLHSYEDGQEYQFSYGLTTSVLDRYGNMTDISNLVPGQIVTIHSLDDEGKIMRMQVSDAVWQYEGATRYSIDEERKLFKLAGSKYTWGEDVFVFSNKKTLALADIMDGDELTVIGYGKQILSIRILTGHGTLALENTSLFEGSFLQLGSKIFTTITENMTMSVPEGTYTLAVANNGWGGTKKVRIKRDQVTTVDLDEIKGDGPSYGQVLFQVDAEDATILVDGKAIDASQPVSLTYGKHRLAVSASGYEDWVRALYVNTPEATIIISLEDESETSTESVSSSGTSSAARQASNSDNSNSGSNNSDNSAQSSNNSSDSSSSSSSDDYLEDYLSTLSSLLDTLN